MPLTTRLRLTNFAACQIATAIPALLLFVCFVLGLALAPLVIGIPILLATLPAVRKIADCERRRSAQTLGIDGSASSGEDSDQLYRPVTGSGQLSWLRSRLADLQTWRDVAFMVIALPLALTFSLLVLLLVIPLVTLGIWWFAVIPIMQLRSRIDRFVLLPWEIEQLEHRVETLTETRAASLQDSAAELRRIERDLHDGPQARIVSLGISLGLAEELIERDPETARKLLAEARASTGTALGEIRGLVRGIHPPVLADRGLDAAIRAISLEMAYPTTVFGGLTDSTEQLVRLPAAIESAVYFAVAECLANIGKHAGASTAWVELTLPERPGRPGEHLVRVRVGDDGRGGADASGSGLRGVARRLEAHDGTMGVSSPVGGPTEITLEVPCASSSPRTMPSSEMA